MLKAERLAAFYDAMMAIIMTILALRLEVPASVTFHTVMVELQGFSSYLLSFLWLGMMWISHYIAWNKVRQVGRASLFATLVVLFFASLFPYSSALVSSAPDSRFANVFYGLVVIMVTLSNMLLTRTVNHEQKKMLFGLLFDIPRPIVLADILVKACGLVLSLFVWAPAMLCAVLINVAVLVIYYGRQTWKSLRAIRGSQSADPSDPIHK